MSTPQNGVAAYSQSQVSGWFPAAFPAVFVFLSVLLWWVVPNCKGFPLTTLSLASSQLLMRTPLVQLARHCWVTHT